MENIDNQTMQERLYNILKMNIKLTKKNKLKVSQDTLDSFREVTIKIDEFNQKEYEGKIESLLKTENTIEGEKKRLEQLTLIIKERLDARNLLLREYKELTDSILVDLPIIAEENDYEELKKRLDDISEYLNNSDKIDRTRKELDQLRQSLYSSETKKQEDENNNKVLEEKLLKEFSNLLSQNTLYNGINNIENIDAEITSLQPELEESKKTLDTFEKALENLLNAGISGQEENDYRIYVSDARNAYYQIKEKEYLFRILKILSDIKITFEDIMLKRDSLDKVLSEREKLRANLSITANDSLKNIYNLIETQKATIILEGININNIEELNRKIKEQEAILEEYEEKNKRGDILTILEEYGLIDTYNEEEMVEDESLDTQSERLEENSPSLIETPEETKAFLDFDTNEDAEVDVDIDPYTIVQVSNPLEKNSLSFAFKKAYSVMRRVGKSLGIVEKKHQDVKTPSTHSTNNLEETVVMAPIVNDVLPVQSSEKEPLVIEDLTQEETTPLIPVLEELKLDKKPKENNAGAQSPSVEQTKPVTPVMKEPLPPKSEPVFEPQVSTQPFIQDLKPERKVATIQDKPKITNNTGFFWPEVETPSKHNQSQSFFPSSSLDLPPIPNSNISLNSQPGNLVK